MSLMYAFKTITVDKYKLFRRLGWAFYAVEKQSGNFKYASFQCRNHSFYELSKTRVGRDCKMSMGRVELHVDEEEELN